jgi:Putative sensor
MDVNKFFRVALEGQTYLNIIYLLLAFPLGLFYFVFLVTGLSLGIGLTMIWIGIPILLLIFAVWWGLAALERQLVIGLLRIDIPPMSRESAAGQGIWAWFNMRWRNPVTWKSLLYLLLKLPLGVVSFVFSVACIAVSGALLTAPLTYSYHVLQIGLWQIGTPGEALIAFALGSVVGLVSLHLMNRLAFVWGCFAAQMLGVTPSADVSPRPAVWEWSAAHMLLDC